VDWIAHSIQLALSLPVAAAQAVDSESASHPTCPTTAGKDLGRLPWPRAGPGSWLWSRNRDRRGAHRLDRSSSGPGRSCWSLRSGTVLSRV